MQELEQFNQECLYAHNGLRKSHGVSSLIFDKKLAIEAQKYAQLIAETKTFHRSKPESENSYGENISQSVKGFVNYVYSGLGATVNWYCEIRNYNFNSENQTTANSTENFTQLVWKDSKKAGFGRARNPINNIWYIVGRYYPQGNVKGSFRENVPPLISRIKWENVSIVEEYLEELQLWEFSKARRHVLDSYVFAVITLTNNKGFLVKETYKSLNGDIYYESQIFDTNITKLPRPMFEDLLSPNELIANIYSQKKEIFGTNDKSPLNLIKNEYLQQTEVELFKKSVLERHNLYRKNYGVQKLSFDDELCKCAQKWADHLRDGYYIGFSHYKFKGSDIGENIAMKSGSLTIESAHVLVDNWYNENKFYFYEMENEDIKEFGHFTQIVWKTTRKIGIGIQSESAGFNFIVCFYYPPGNIRSKFGKMVPRLI